MTNSNQRDESIDKLLRGGFQTRPAADESSDACVDAEVLAAWTEGRLPQGEAARVEVHLSSCATCQEVLAVFARTEPAPEVTPALWHRWRLGWAVPIAAAATAAAIWVAVPDDRGADEFERTVAPAISEAQPQPRPPASVAAPGPVAEPRQAASRRDATRPSIETREEQESFADSVDNVGGARAREANERDQDRKAEAAPQAAAARSASPPQAAAPAQDDSRLRSEQAGLLRQAPPVEAVSPDPLVRWRILPPGRLERSTNGGKTWDPVPLPQPIELTVVRAPSATSAIVTAADGRQFRTDDQGKTWMQVTP